MKIFALITLLLFTTALVAESLTIFAASSTKPAMQEIISEFNKHHPNTQIRATYSATGKAYAQFSNGFKYDIFIAADSSYPTKIYSDKNAITKPRVYAYGALALIALNSELIKGGLMSIKSEDVKHLSIANPRLAPYGVAALEILKNAGIEDEAKSKLVLGDNIAQSVQFVDSGAAEMGLVALSLIKSTKKEGEYLLIDPSLYRPMQQAFVLTKYAKEKPIAQEFGDFLLGDFAQKSFHKHGFGRAK